jgi:hypothetical protein
MKITIALNISDSLGLRAFGFFMRKWRLPHSLPQAPIQLTIEMLVNPQDPDTH